MERLLSTGLGVKKQRSPTNYHKRGELSVGKRYLGDRTPQVLVNNMLFLCDIHFILCRGEEHRSLQHSQVQFVCPPDGQEHLIYTENL